MKEINLRNKLNIRNMFSEIGGNFTKLVEAVHELVDNSGSNFIANSEIIMRTVNIRVYQVDNKYTVVVEDNGSGIQNLSGAFAIGNKDYQETPLNSHAFGLKSALSFINSSWKVYTKRKHDSYYSVVQSPYSENLKAIRYNGNLPGNISSEHGTIIKFNVSTEMLRTIVKGISGNYTKFSTIMSVLQEDLGFHYGRMISKGQFSIVLSYKDNTMKNFKNLDIHELKPSYYNTIEPGTGETTLNNAPRGPIKLDYEFYNAKPSSKYHKYYLANMNSSGVELRINGRAIDNSIFTDIWGIDKHNTYNYLLIIINIKSKYLNRLPQTKTNKTSLRQDDPCLHYIYSWIRSKLPAPKRNLSPTVSEKVLFNELRDQKRADYKEIDPSATITTEQKAYNSLNENIKIDLYQCVNGNTTIYEGKKYKSHPQNIYQLLMYCDGLQYDDIKVDKAILIAKTHPNSVKKIIKAKNQFLAETNASYRIITKTWHDENIHFPN